MTSEPTSPNNKAIELVDVLESLTLELKRTTECGQMLEDYVASLAPLLPKGAALEEMQAVDALVQSIDNLSRFSAALTNAVREVDQPIDLDELLKAVSLADMAARLRGGATHVEEEEPVRGELELF